MPYFVSLLVLTLSVAGNAILGFLVLRKNPKSATHIIFAALNVTLFVYAIINFFSIHETDSETALFLVRILMLFPVFHTSAIFLFLNTFPSEHFRLTRSALAFLVVPSLLCMALAVSPWLFTDMVFIDGRPRTITGWGMAIYMPVLLAFIVASFVQIIRRFQTADALLRIQLKLIMVGLTIMIALFANLNFLVVVFFDNTSFIEFAPLYILVFVSFTAYAILRHRLFNTRVIIQKSLIYGLSVILITLLYGAVISYLETIAPLSSPISLIIAPIFLLLGFESVKKIVQNLLDRYLFTDVLDLSVHLDFEKRFANVRGELEEWFSKISQEITDTLGAQDVKLFLADQMNHDVVQFFPKGNTRFSEDQKGVRFLSKVTEPSLLSVLVEQSGHSAAVHGFLNALRKRSDVVVPLLTDYGRLLGFLLLRQKERQKMYSLADLQKLRDLAQSFTPSLNESITYSEALQKFRISFKVDSRI